MTTIPFQFQPISSSWVALHPCPKGVIQFIGGAFLGRMPTVYYRWFFRQLFENGYTIVAFPFRSTFNHWSIALDLLEGHYRLRSALIEMAFAASQYSDCNYQVYLNPENYTWLGHSLGCKYVALLEILTEVAPDALDALKTVLQPQQLESLLSKLTDLDRQIQVLSHLLELKIKQKVNFGSPGIFNESSILMAPVITDLSMAIPSKGLQTWIEMLGIQVVPTIEQTHQLINRSQAFNLTAILQFQSDRYAKPTCDRLCHDRGLKANLLPGSHVEPILYDGSDVYLAVLQSLNELKSRLHSNEPSMALAFAA